MQSEIAALFLFELERFEEGFEIAFAEGLAAAAADDFEEESGAVLEGFGEELEEVAFIVSVDEDAQFVDLFVVFLHGFVTVRLKHGVDAVPDFVVVGIGEREEIDAAGAEGGDGVEFIIGAEGKVLHAGGVAVPVEIFLHLRFLFTGSGFVDRHFDQVIAAGHDF